MSYRTRTKARNRRNFKESYLYTKNIRLCIFKNVLRYFSKPKITFFRRYWSGWKIPRILSFLQTLRSWSGLKFMLHKILFSMLAAFSNFYHFQSFLFASGKLTNNMFWKFTMFLCKFDLSQVRRNLISSKINFEDELPHELPNNLRSTILKD